jgi:small-conductance mechanosensitive channel
MTHLTTGTFYDAQTANKAVNAIIAMDYPRDRINVILSRQTRQRFWDAGSRDHERVRATTMGGSSDDIIGSLLANEASRDRDRASTSTGSDDADALIVVGPSAATPPGDGTDSVGRALDALTRLGFPRGDAERLRNDIRSGGIVVDATEFADSAINLTVRYWTASEKQAVLRTQTRAIIALKEAFDGAAIEIPFPIRTLYYASGQEPGSAPHVRSRPDSRDASAPS